MLESDKRAAFLGASLDPHLFTIDLHQSGDLYSALEDFDRGLDRAMNIRSRACRVVYGLGQGILSKEIHKKLNQSKNILGWQEEETGGSALILL